MRLCTQHPVPPHPQWMAQMHQSDPKECQHFWGAQDELSIEDGIFLKGDCICIPPELFDRTLANLHEGNQQVDEMQLLT